MTPKIAIVYYSMYGHIKQLVCVKIEETLFQEVLTKMYVPAKADVAVLSDPAQLEEFDGILVGIPTRYGNFPAQSKTFWDKSGKQWQQGGGQESTAIASMSTLVHHGFIFVPLGYKTAFGPLANLDEVHDGSPWVAETRPFAPAHTTTHTRDWLGLLAALHPFSLNFQSHLVSAARVEILPGFISVFE
ncbi:minor allergen Alt a 7 [Stagonosporopsis vannaccii]|nr:minor allergen Alt a 7 [Stagonosporopsis vannaccii]